MSMSNATTMRLPKIKVGLMSGKTYSEIGAECGVTLKTIYRDVQVWTQTPEFDYWLDAEWVRLKTQAEQEDLIEVFRQLTKLKVKRITQKFEAKTEATLKHVEEKRDVTIIAEYTRAIDSAVDRDIKALRARKQVDTPRANTKTD